jgi:hypothetical protein
LRQGDGIDGHSIMPLRILDGDFPDRAEMRDIAEHNLLRALEVLAR